MNAATVCSIKICHVSTLHNENDSRVFYKECVSAKQHGYCVTLLVPGECTKQFTKEGVVVKTIRWKNKSRSLRVLFLSLKFFYIAYKEFADIYHLHDPELLPYGLLLKLQGRTVIFDSHEDNPNQVLTKEWIPKHLRKCISFIYKTVEAYIIRRLDSVICATPFILERIQKLTKHTVCIANYPRLEEFKHNEENYMKQDYCCYVGTISRSRSILEMMQGAQIASVPLHICGEFSDNKTKIEMMALPEWNNVIYHGYANRREVSELISLCKVGLVVLKETPNHIMSLPIKMFEYMACKAVVVASNFTYWKEIIEANKCGICIDPNSKEEIAEAIKRAIRFDNEILLMTENGYRLVNSSLNWGTQEVSLIRLYDELSIGKREMISKN